MSNEHAITFTVLNAETREVVKEGAICLLGDKSRYKESIGEDGTVTFAVINGTYTVNADVPGYIISEIPNLNVKDAAETIELQALPE
jgi:hypothetical protein